MFICRKRDTVYNILIKSIYDIHICLILLGLYGIPLVLIVFGLQIYTAILLGKSWIIASTLDPQISRKNRYLFPLVSF